MWNPYDELHESDGHPAEPGSRDRAAKGPTRTVISVVLSPEVEANADVMACAVEAIRALPYVVDVTTRKVYPRPHGIEPEPAQ